MTSGSEFGLRYILGEVSSSEALALSLALLELGFKVRSETEAETKLG